MPRLNAAFLRALDLNADPVSGGLVYVFNAGTTTPATTYSDNAQTTVNAHPIVADAEGRFPDIYLSPGFYKVRKTNADSAVLDEADNVEVESNVQASYASRGDLEAAIVANEEFAVGVTVEADGIFYEYIGADDTSGPTDLPGFFPIGPVIDVEAWGVPVTTASHNEAWRDILAKYQPATADFQHSPSVTIRCSSQIECTGTLLAYDTVAADGNSEAMGVHVDYRHANIVPASGASFAATDFLMHLRARNCDIWLPGRDMGGVCSGIHMDRCITANIRGNNIGQRAANGGYDVSVSRLVDAADIEANRWYRIKSVGDTDFTAIGASASTVGTLFFATGAGTGTGVVLGKGEADNSVMHGFQSYEETLSDPIADRQAVGLHINAFDFSVVDYRGGWCGTPILLDPGCAEVTFQRIHPFNGRGLNNTAIDAPTNPTLIESHTGNDYYIVDSYVDNGLIHNYGSGRPVVIHGHALALDGSVIIDGPILREYCHSSQDGENPKVKVFNTESLTVGFYPNPGDSSIDWDGDYTVANTFWDEQELEETVTNVLRRAVNIYTGVGDVPPSEQNVIPGGRLVKEYHGPNSGFGRVVFDPENREYRLEFGRTVNQGITNYGPEHDLTISNGTIDISVVGDRKTRIRLSAESGTADELTNIIGGQDGDKIVLMPVDGHSITLRHDTEGDDNGTPITEGKLFLRRQARDILLERSTHHFHFIHDGFNCIASDSSDANAIGQSPDEQTDYTTRGALAAAWSDGLLPDGTIMRDGVVEYVAISGSTEISDLPGLEPNGQAKAEHYGTNTTPGTTDMGAHILSALAYSPEVKLRGEAYATSVEIEYNNKALIGSGNQSTKIIGLSASLAVGDAIVTPGGSSSLRDIWIAYDALTGTEAQDERVGLNLGGESASSISEFKGAGVIDSIVIDNCGTAICDSGNGTFSGKIGAIEIKAHSYAAYEIRGTQRTGNIVESLYINGGDAYTPTYGVNVEGQMSGGTIAQVNVEHQAYSGSAFRAKGSHGLQVASLHLEGVDTSAAGKSYIEIDEAYIEIGTLSVLNTRMSYDSTRVVEFKEADYGDQAPYSYEAKQSGLTIGTYHAKGLANPNTTEYPSYPSGRVGLSNVSGFMHFYRAASYADANMLLSVGLMRAAAYSGRTDDAYFENALTSYTSTNIQVLQFGPGIEVARPTVYVSASGTGGGRTAADPTSLDDAISRVKKQSKGASGVDFTIVMAAGTYTPTAQVDFDSGWAMGTNSLKLQGPDVSGGVPTAIVSGASLTETWLKKFAETSPAVNIHIEDVKFTGFAAGRRPVDLRYGGSFYSLNAHADGAGGYAILRGVYSEIRGSSPPSVIENFTDDAIICQNGYGSVGDGSLVDEANQIEFDGTGAAVQWSRGQHGYVRSCVFTNCEIGIDLSRTSRVRTQNNEFTAWTLYAISKDGTSVWNDDSSNPDAMSGATTSTPFLGGQDRQIPSATSPSILPHQYWNGPQTAFASTGSGSKIEISSAATGGDEALGAMRLPGYFWHSPTAMVRMFYALEVHGTTNQVTFEVENGSQMLARITLPSASSALERWEIEVTITGRVAGQDQGYYVAKAFGTGSPGTFISSQGDCDSFNNTAVRSNTVAINDTKFSVTQSLASGEVRFVSMRSEIQF